VKHFVSSHKATSIITYIIAATYFLGEGLTFRRESVVNSLTFFLIIRNYIYN